MPEPIKSLLDFECLVLSLFNTRLRFLTDLFRGLFGLFCFLLGIVDAVLKAGNIRFHAIDAFIGFHFDVVDTGIGISHAPIRFLGGFLSFLRLAPCRIGHPLVIADGIDDEFVVGLDIVHHCLHTAECDLGNLDIFTEFVHCVNRGDNLGIEIAQERRLLTGERVVCHAKGRGRSRGIDEIEIDGGHHHEFIDLMGL